MRQRLELFLPICNAEQAAATLNTTATTASDTTNDDASTRIQATANFYRAMSLFQEDHPAEARTLFTATEANIKPLPADEKNPLADNANYDDLILWLAYKEAKALIQFPNPTPSAGTSSTPK